MDLAGELIQDIAVYLGVEELASIADFPKDMNAFQHTLTQVWLSERDCQQNHAVQLQEVFKACAHSQQCLST